MRSTFHCAKVLRNLKAHNHAASRNGLMVRVLWGADPWTWKHGDMPDMQHGQHRRALTQRYRKTSHTTSALKHQVDDLWERAVAGKHLTLNGLPYHYPAIWDGNDCLTTWYTENYLPRTSIEMLMSWTLSILHSAIYYRDSDQMSASSKVGIS
jgi:hypothetical protein